MKEPSPSIFIYKTNRTSIKIEFDQSGAEELAAVFKAPEKKRVLIAIDRVLIYNRPRKRDFILTPFLVKIDEEEDVFHCLPEEVILSIDKDSTEFIAKRFTNAVKLGFFPAEIAEVFVKPINKSFMLYAEFKKSKSVFNLK
ncbi:hypothetical protein LEP1GSC151_1089 [Leptospira interrogans serovar Grippotyphosa str. LT2186]|uniref:Uncharacterized protein n=1 Tax=Leptospira interrogans serovar Grippotyphosa str. LT2186 TaxID=1001599 RepID=M3GYL7_LEPIR|nr:hypothetical protein [Leptospira interrogans]EKR45051.1 hypothetical protein LEP1GSC097_3463 [Leptospira interrogans serovar Grippotyphosa str. UI 08368]EMG11833.1 hypothetical protein LEP1GSC151_1089 [Leptospira interrogans serovar Grippotyphosa str. LT2186]EMN85990.1 hypothetical protein LEP1GSC107_3066 [Leptospira interrogans serovar Grippotyphosa str. UI 12769]